MEQLARNLTDPVDGFLSGSRIFIHDRDPLYTRHFREILRSGGVRSVRLPARSPNLKGYASHCTSCDRSVADRRSRSQRLTPFQA